MHSAVKSPGSQISAGLSLLERCWRRFVGFLFPFESDTWLAVLRIGLGLQVIVYALFLRSDWHYLFASSGKGLVGREVGEAITTFDSPLIPKLGWLIAVGRNLNMNEETVLTVAWVCLLSAGCLLLLGLLSRPAAIVAWFVHLCAAESGGLLAYGADNFMTTALFYLMLSPLPDRYAFDNWVVKSKAEKSTHPGFLAPSVTGASVFCLLHRRPGKISWQRLVGRLQSLAIADQAAFSVIAPDILVRFKYALPLLGISICLLEMSYPFFIWLRRTRRIWLGCILAMHAAIGLMMGLYLFALVMIVMNLAAFGVPSTGRRAEATLPTTER